MLRVFVALGKQLPKNKAMIEDTEEVGKLLAKYNCTLVQGGARIGLMGVVLKEFQKYSDEVVLIVPELHKTDLDGTTSKEHYIVEGEADRLKITINTCDLIVVLPGGTGTLAELSYYNETYKSGEHNSKIVMINTKGFYNKLFKFINHQTKCGFMKKEHFNFEVINSAKQLEPIIRQLITEKQSKIHQELVKNSVEEFVDDAKEVAEVETVKPAKKSTKTTSKPAKSKTVKNSNTDKNDKTNKDVNTNKTVKEDIKLEKVSTKITEKAKATKIAEKAKATKETVKPNVENKKTTKAKALKVINAKDENKVEAKVSNQKAKASETKSQTKSTSKAKTTENAKPKTSKTKSTTDTKKSVKATTKSTSKSTKKSVK